MNDGVPVLKSFFKQFPAGAKAHGNSDLAESLREQWRYKFSRECKFEDLEPTSESRYSFWLAFGITPDEQIALEQGFQPLKMAEILEQPEEEVTLLRFSGA
jgi:hypothetical protein